LDVVRCSECGNAVPLTATICPYDGNRIERAATRVEPAPTPHAEQRPPAGDDPFAAAGLAVDLVVSSSRGERSVVLRTGDRLEIGREIGPLTDLCTDNVSAHHAEITVGSDCVEIRDTGRNLAGSTNGTYLNGERLPPNAPTRLVDGSVVTCGTDPPLTIGVTVTEA